MKTLNHSRARGGRGGAVALALVAVTAGGTLVGAPAEGAPGRRLKPEELLRTNRGAVATVHPIASKIGIDVLNSGGNAIDAAVAMAFALGVVRPDLTGLGGGGFMVYRSADGRQVKALDFRETAPADVTANFRDGPGPDDFTYLAFGGAGHRTVGVPGMVAGLAEALRVHGTKSLREVVAKSVPLARDGFIVSPELAELLSLGAPYLRLFPETSRIYLPYSSRGGREPQPLTDPVVFALFDTPEGTPAEGPAREALWLQQPDLANSLEAIADQGRDAFYLGEIATKLVEEFETSVLYPGNAARLEYSDLANYQAIWREPVRSTYRGNKIIGAPAPASGGIVLAETLNILEGYDLASMGPSSAEYLHYFTEALKISLADRKKYMGDPKVTAVPEQLLTSKAYAAERRAEIELGKTKIYDPAGGPATEPAECTIPAGMRHTTHVSVIDESGNAVSMTLSINGVFGSGVVAKDTGILLNNHLLDFDTVNALCQPSNGQTGANNAPGPGRRPVSANSPTIVVRGNKAILAVGAAGGPTILRGIPQAVINFLDFGMDVAHAIDSERVFPANVAAPPVDGEQYKAVDVLDMEGKRIPLEVRTKLREWGHRIPTFPTNAETVEYAGLPELEGVGRLASGWLMPYSDPRSENGAMVQQPRG